MRPLLWVALVGSALVHAGVVAAMMRPVPGPRPRTFTTLELATIARKPPPPRTNEPAPPPPPPPRPPRARKAPRAPVEPRVAAAPPPRTPAPPPAAPPKVGIDEKSTTPGGTMAVATGVTRDGVMGTGSGNRPAPAAAAPTPAPVTSGRGRASGPGFVPIFQVTRMPRALRAVEPEIPAAFRSAGREAVVVIEVEIAATGKVLRARVLRGARFGLDEAAVRAAERTDFEPALVGTRPVAVKLQLPFRFRVRG